MMPVEVRCFGDQRLDEGNLKVIGFELDTSNFTCPKPLRSAFGAVRRCVDFNTININADLVHCHTWYTHFGRSEEHTSELQSRFDLVCRLLLEKKKKKNIQIYII